MDANLKILAIDDNRDNLTTIQAVLGDVLPGCTLLTALNGPRGIALARAEDPDAILLDIVMPDMDGFEVCRRLKAEERLRDIPVIFLTALRTDRESRVNALEVGAEAFLSKPIDESELVAQLRAMAKLKAANRLRRLERDELAALVAERTRALETELAERKRTEEQKARLEGQLLHAQKMESVGLLAGGVAHDFNNLLCVILNHTEIALESIREGDPLRENLLEVMKAGERATSLTRQLLAFSRKQVMQPVPLSLNKIAQATERMLRRILGEDIELVQSLAPDLGVVRADPSQIEQVLMNLVVNARDAMPMGGTLSIETSNVEIDEAYAACHVDVKPGPYVQLAVSDTGCGMDQQTQAKLFEPFFTTKEVGKGTGLGLSTAYGIVKQSHGSIWVYSEPGRGTTFKIYLPRENPDIAPTTTKPAPFHKLAKGTETILVVEDEEALRKIAERILCAAGYTVLTAADGDAALRASQQHESEIHLLLTDVIMPRMSGRMLVERLTAIRPTVKVLYMSGYTDNAIVHHGVLDAKTNFIGKPFSAADLTWKVREVLDGRTVAGE